eukprot:CAMPEP_0202703926 /NCGR_PEP_ID=MMETSP1385-20130828/16711_1 /ASSEMBLY_ACC=CAM_ASM_000861 /TAXON_ID=933848 /ORGANISM="Elphidium margaritaceum" /LENGTH=462 /DNA_ID=CAMNT_0049361855 /DNA_START=45 /DNA_END=1433 /DNA_ORIENTATION=+
MSSTSAKVKVISREEFAAHHFRGDCWIEIEGNVYDVSQWMKKHPGGERLLECLGGKDATLPFLLNHKPWIRQKYLSSMCIGELAPKTTKGKYDDLTTDFIALYRELSAKGWFTTSAAYYVKKFCIVIAMLCGVIYLMQLSRAYDSLVLAAVASILLGMFWQQSAFLGHDLGHNGMTHINKLDCGIGFIIGNLCQGISVGWWKYTHNVHHVRTNDGEWDPDIQHMPMIAMNEKYLEGVWSQFHRAQLPPTDTLTLALSKVFVGYQQYHWLFSMMMARVFLYLSSFVYAAWQLPRQQNGTYMMWRVLPLIEFGTLVLFHVWSISLFMTYTPQHPVLFYFMAYFTAGILHVQIIMNHFPCPVFDDIEEDNFVLHQLRSSMAVSSNTYTHWFHGGLQFQVEHHLFPMMPRHNLRKVKPYILELAKKYDIPYLENTFLGAIFDIHRILKNVAKHSEKLNMRFEQKTN